MKSSSQKILSDFIHQSCGITLGPEKHYLLEQRLHPLLKEFKLNDLDHFAEAIVAHTVNQYALREKVITAITTNETSFFRDGNIWTVFQNTILPELVTAFRACQKSSAKRSKIRIWSAACSSGQEPYTIAISILEYLRTRHLTDITSSDFEIFATDISPKILERAKQGVYSTAELARGLDLGLRYQYFCKYSEQEYQASNDLRKHISFKPINLMSDFSHLGNFDIIFCRNVLIYFDDASKRKIVESFRKMLLPQGLLVLGSAENLYGLNSGFSSQHTGGAIYYRRDEE